MIALYIILGIVGLFLLLAVVNGKTMTVECTTIINKEAKEVFDYVKLLDNHRNFNMWMMMDPNMKRTTRGTDGTVGYVYAWDSTVKNVGAGEQEISEIKNGQTITYELRFFRPMQDVAKTVLSVTPTGAGQAKVNWGFYGNMKFPMTAIKGLMKSMLSKSLSQSLANLKKVMES